ncbi:hypothetical protein N8I82_06745 [Granulicatella adiacens]|jgi:hypothetical protein|uniref:hypothetical protein n=1 Tax=Granulicatella adiacens TaxID=46124 RepID=UPI0021DA1C02|nr:hypothetical protein [Granulicatella adiacens]UXY40897.1 hypothetical protein N8I82_06745 [Granulicatella adiacens]
MNTWEEKLEQIEKELSELDTNITKAQKNLEKTNTELVEIEKAATTFTEHKKVQSLKEEITFLEKMIEDLSSKRKQRINDFIPEFNNYTNELRSVSNEMEKETISKLEQLKENFVTEFEKIMSEQKQKYEERKTENELKRDRLKKIFDYDLLTEKGYFSLREAVENFGITSFYHHLKVNSFGDELKKLSI